MLENSANSILIADDNPNNLKVLSSMLEEQGYKVRISSNGEQVLKSVEMIPPDLIMLDIHMPLLDGYDTCKRLKADERFKDIPVIFISAMSEAFNKVLAFDSGGIDYIVKPFQLEEVYLRVKTHLMLKEYMAYKQNTTDTLIHSLNISGLKDAVEKIEQAYMHLCNGNENFKMQKEHLEVIGESLQKVKKIIGDLSSQIVSPGKPE